MSCIITLFHLLNSHVPIFSKDLCLFNQAHVKSLKPHNKNQHVSLKNVSTLQVFFNAVVSFRSAKFVAISS